MPDERFDRIDARFDNVEGAVRDLRTGLDEVRSGLDEVRSGLSEVRAGLSEVRTGLSQVDRHMRVLHEEVLDRMRALDPGLELRLALRRQNAALLARMDSYEVRNEDKHRFFKSRLDELG